MRLQKTLTIKREWKLLHVRVELTPDAHLAYITPFHSPSMVQKDFLSLGGLVRCEKKKIKTSGYRQAKGWGLHFATKPCVTHTHTHTAKMPPVHSQDVASDPVLLAPIERLGVEHDGGTVARLGAGDAALAAQLHPGHC